MKDRLFVDAAVRNLEVLGEAAKNAPADVRLQQTSIAWSAQHESSTHSRLTNRKAGPHLAGPDPAGSTSGYGRRHHQRGCPPTHL